MKIGIDARFLTHPQRGGFKTYSENLIAGLAQVDAKNEYILYLDRPPDETTLLPKRPNFRTCVVAGTAPVFGMPWREQVELARQAARDRVDLIHSPCLTAPLFSTCPLVVTIHDTIWLFPTKFSSGKPTARSRKMMEWYYRWVPQFAARKANAILTVSEAAKASIVQNLDAAAERVWVTLEAANSNFRPIDDARQLDEVRSKFNLSSAFILAIGSADPRKNLSTLIQAYARLPISQRDAYPLAIVWTHDLLEAELANQIAQLGLQDNLHFLKGVTNNDLVLLYNAAALFVFPSLYEGFGLPVLEAMACGTPVVASNNSSIPEIAGDAALLVGAVDVQGMAEAMTRVLTDESVRRTLKQKGLARAAGFSWEQCASQTIAVYTKTLAAGRAAKWSLDAYPS